MKALLFDFGGTLDTNGTHWSEKFWDVYQELKIGVSKEDFKRAYLAAESRMAPGVMGPQDSLLTTLKKQVSFQYDALRAGGRLAGSGTLSESPDRVAAVCYDHVQSTIRSIRPLLAACRQKYHLAVVSNFYGNLRAVCTDLDIEQYFDAIVDSEIVSIRKPEPEIFRIALVELALQPHQAMVIGDSYERDVMPAKTIGCYTTWLRGRSWREPLETARADYVIHSLTDLYSFLKPASQLVTLS